MKYRFWTCDVFTETRFGGNPLAVLPYADGLSDDRMQQIAREFNFSETAFVFKSEVPQTRKVRIFTPKREVPFAGHPNVGSAFVLATIGELGEIGDSQSVTFEEKAGLVPITIHGEQGRVISCQLAAPQELSFGKAIAPEQAASALSLDVEEIVTETHPPQVASVGLSFLMVELKDSSALERAQVNLMGFEAIRDADIRPSVYVYTQNTTSFDLQARMFAPLNGVPEDPATGSAGCAVAGLLAHFNEKSEGTFNWRIAQGVEMGRPSTLLTFADKKGGEVKATGVGGGCVMVSQGDIEVD